MNIPPSLPAPATKPNLIDAHMSLDHGHRFTVDGERCCCGLTRAEYDATPPDARTDCFLFWQIVRNIAGRITRQRTS